MLTGAPSPGIPFTSSKLNRGLNFVSVCLTLGTSLLAVSPSDLWVDGQEIQPGVKVLSGPFHMSAITDQHRPVASCHASLSILPPDPLEPLAAQDIASDLEPAFTTTFAVECKRKQADIPLNILLGHVRPSTLLPFSQTVGWAGSTDSRYHELHLLSQTLLRFLQHKHGKFLNSTEN